MNTSVNIKQIALLFIFILASCSMPEHNKLSNAPITPDNCGVGCPTGGSTQTLTRDTYTLNNNSATKFANWVAYHVTKESIKSGCSRTFAQDPSLPATDTLGPDAYKDAHATIAVDRGHQAPLGMLCGRSDPASLNYLSNITPQKSALNQGPWERLESKEREYVLLPTHSDLHVVTGPLFEQTTESLPADTSVKIPSGYWKVLYTGDTPEKGQFAAFIMPQSASITDNFCDYRTTVSEIESRTKSSSTPALNIWPTMTPDKKKTFGTLSTDLGCPTAYAAN
ncbi:DNA/RNA non-specific endonuclease [Kluyvera ascorbata]|uniref:DNA/RNA non-specific endonuclease n=1 Tax=Kluyvera ascorbata TaxID=51288 RepID=A0A3N2SFD3_9ENTR|nr:DNA/RNA non-specific endonuclease [Kluyvera ascorbata]ROU18335.1 DNA/RNA non-specific endonuclease [Kluyvera ascorbata]